MTKADIPCSGPLINLAELAKKPLHPKVAQTTAIGADNEADLVLSRGKAEFDWKKLDLSAKHVCDAHYQHLMANEPYTLDSRQTVNEPVGAGSFGKKKTQPRRYFACDVEAKLGEVVHDGVVVEADAGAAHKIDSQAVLKYCKYFLPIGTPLCDAHRREIDEFVQRFRNKERSVSSGSSYQGSGGKEAKPQPTQPPPSEEEQLWEQIRPEAEKHVRALARLFGTPLNIMFQDWTAASSLQPLPPLSD